VSLRPPSSLSAARWGDHGAWPCIGNSSRLSWSLLSPGGTLAGLLANQFGEAEGLQVNSLMYAALILVVITLSVNVLGELVLRYTQSQTAGIR